MNVTFRFCFRSPLKSLKLPVFKGLSTDLGSHSFLHISFYPLYFYSFPLAFAQNIPIDFLNEVDKRNIQHLTNMMKFYDIEVAVTCFNPTYESLINFQ